MDVDMNTVAFDVTNGGVTVLCDHVWGEWTNNVSGNNHQRVCEKCGEPQYAAHDWGNGEEVLAPSCTEEGSQEYTCSVCNATKTETVSSLGHVMTYHAQVDATCTQAGSIAYYSCSRCGKNFSDEAGETELDDTSITALGHTMTYHARVESTCTQAGTVAYYSCSRCGKNFSDEAGETELDDTSITALGHTMTYHARVEATCTQIGTVAHYSCSRCGKNFSDQAGETELDDISITALGHTMTYHARVEATCTQAGTVAYYSCSRCGKNFSDEAGETELDDTRSPRLDTGGMRNGHVVIRRIGMPV